MVTGIIMECNPFHDGHQYILDAARRTTNADYVVVVLSGDYVQRGIPAIASKEVRTRKVLDAGADLVLELPLPYATGAANYFARGAVQLLVNLGVITDLAFGSLSADANAITRAAALLDEEPPQFQALLQSGLAAGLSYPAARAGAAAGALGISLPTNGNDVLGIEYVRALNKSGSNHNIRIHAIPRIETDSATTHRVRLLKAQQQNMTGRRPSLLPDQTICGADACDAAQQRNPGIDTDTVAAVPYYMSASDLSEQLYYQLQRIAGLSGADDAAAALMAYQDVDHDLACRMIRLLPEYTGWDDYAARLKTRNVTFTRVSRALLHILLGIRQDDVAALSAAGTIGYARILGFRRSAGPLLAAIREQASVPLITSPRDALRSQDIPPLFQQQLRRDLAASELYDAVLWQRSQPQPHAPICELTKQMIII